MFRAPIPQDSYLCWTGATYQTDCGRFHTTHGNTATLNTDNYGVCQGDSGGPVYAAGAGYRIVIATAGGTTISTTDWRYFAPGLTVACTSYNYGEDGMTYEGLGTSLRALNVQLIP